MNILLIIILNNYAFAKVFDAAKAQFIYMNTLISMCRSTKQYSKRILQDAQTNRSRDAESGCSWSAGFSSPAVGFSSLALCTSFMSRNFRSGAVGFEHREFNRPAPCEVVCVELPLGFHGGPPHGWHTRSKKLFCTGATKSLSRNSCMPSHM